jgi:methyl-accepting chemotaxis protein
MHLTQNTWSDHPVSRNGEEDMEMSLANPKLDTKLQATFTAMSQATANSQQNAGRAHHADGFMTESMPVSSNSPAAMNELTYSMPIVPKTNGDRSKLVRAIDEIAFETNLLGLLALDAALDAARSGEPGASFAEVADGVRGMAMCAAEVAKNTADWVEDSLIATRMGSDMVARTKTAFAMVASQAKQVAELVNEIALTPRDRWRVGDPIYPAAAEVDQGIRQSAANGEKFASTSEELNDLAVQLRSFISALVVLVEGNGSQKAGKQAMTDLTKQRDTQYPPVHP